MRTTIVLRFVAAAFMTSFFSCSGQAQQSESVTKDLTAKEFHEKIVQLQDEQVLDVRTPEEWESGTLPDALSINWFDTDFENKANKLDKSKPVMVYCASGGRSGQAMAKLKSMGFKEVYNLAGGIGAWRKSGYEVEK